ncbi:MAG: hypothetical protein ACXAE3_00675 [Candidatus Kariarchaeaceae archaeon]|jgi:uncharacterized membrane protein HdeD (DUF308 family)
MSSEPNTTLKERIKSFLIVGETLDGIFTFEEMKLVNIFTASVLLISGVYSGIQALMFGSFWFLLMIGFILGGIYFSLLYKVRITYAITRFRIIRLENDLVSEWFFQSSRLLGFSDLHYEHVESINVGSSNVNMPRFYVSLLSLSIGWYLSTQVTETATSLITLIGSLLIVASLINIIFSLPLGGVKLVVQSISGETMSLPEKHTPPDFVDELILSSRTFLSYGAQ